MFKTIRKILAFIGYFVIVVASVFYIQSPVYDFHKPEVLNADNSWYNPYQNLTDSAAQYKINFHTHSKGKSGLFNGVNTPQQLKQAYDSLNYTYSYLSNYQSLEPLDTVSPWFMPVYEHGYNLFKTHQLGINAKKVVYLDYPLFQSLSQKQHIINRLQSNSSFVVLNHATLLNGYRSAELKQLSNFNALEIFSFYTNSTALWDSILSSNFCAWGIANDDCHTLNDQGKFGLCWNNIFAPQPDSSGVLNALKTGAYTFAKGWVGKNLNKLIALQISNDSIHLSTLLPAEKLVAITTNGRVVVTEKNVKNLSIRLDPNERYYRFEIYNQHFKLFTNPIYKGTQELVMGPPKNFTPNTILTYLWRLLIAILLVLSLFKLYQIVLVNSTK